MDGSAERLGRINDHHVTLSQIKKLVKEAMETLKKERDQFEEIQKIYNAGDIPCESNRMR